MDVVDVADCSRVWGRQVLACNEALRPTNVLLLDSAAFEVEIEALVEIVAAIILDSRTAASLEAVELLESLVRLLVNAEQPSHASSHSLVAISEDDWRTKVGEQHKEQRKQRDARLFYDALLPVNQRQQSVREVC